MKKITLTIFAIIFMYGISYAQVTFNLRWIPPVLNEDGTPITDLAGFKLYWGTESIETTPYPNQIDVGMSNPYSLPVPDGCYYFNVTAYDTSGNESDFNGEVYGCKDSVKTAPCTMLELF